MDWSYSTRNICSVQLRKLDLWQLFNHYASTRRNESTSLHAPRSCALSTRIIMNFTFGCVTFYSSRRFALFLVRLDASMNVASTIEHCITR